MSVYPRNQRISNKTNRCTYYPIHYPSRYSAALALSNCGLNSQPPTSNRAGPLYLTTSTWSATPPQPIPSPKFLIRNALILEPQARSIGLGR
jgi:hypothetical protein